MLNINLKALSKIENKIKEFIGFYKKNMEIAFLILINVIHCLNYKI